MSIDTEHRLPRHLIARAVTEHEAHGMILLDTAALLVEAGAHPGDLEKLVFQQSTMMERT